MDNLDLLGKTFTPNSDKIDAILGEIIKPDQEIEKRPTDPELNYLKNEVAQLSGIVNRIKIYIKAEEETLAKPLLSLAYKYAQSRKLREEIKLAKTYLSDFERHATKYERRKKAFRDRGVLKSKKNELLGIKKQVKESYNEFLSSFGQIEVLVQEEIDKISGVYYTNFNNTYEVDLGDSDEPVALEYAPLIVGVVRPIDEEYIGSTDYDIEHLESFLYIFKSAKLVGLKPSILPQEFTEETLRKVVKRYTQKDFDLCPLRMSHPSSKRIWFLVLETQLNIRFVQFADKQLSPELNTPISNILTEEEAILTLTKSGILQSEITQIISRWKKADNNRQRNAIIMEAVTRRKRVEDVSKQRRSRLLFEIELKPVFDTIKLLEDDYLTYKERADELEQRFLLLTSPDATVEKGLSFTKYAKLGQRFHQLESLAVRGVSDAYQRALIRKGIRNDRVEARRLYWEWVGINNSKKKALASQKKLQGQIEFLKKQAFEGNDISEHIEHLIERVEA